MLILCTICRELYKPNSEVVLNNCGHMFHHNCLKQWFLRATTCPQCRSKCNRKTIFKVFLDFTDSAGKKDVESEFLDLKIEMIKMNEKISDLQKKTREDIEFCGTTILDVKKELVNHKFEAVKSSLRYTDLVETVIHGTTSKVSQLLLDETDKGALALLSVALKRSLVAQENKANLLQNMLKHSRKESVKFKMERSNLELQNAYLRTKLNASTKKLEVLKQELRDRYEKTKKLCGMSERSPTWLEAIKTTKKGNRKSQSQSFSVPSESSSSDGEKESQCDQNFPYRKSGQMAKFSSVAAASSSLRNESISTEQSAILPTDLEPCSSGTNGNNYYQSIFSGKTHNRRKASSTVNGARLRKMGGFKK